MARERRRTGRARCQVCGSDPRTEFGMRPEYFLEAHGEGDDPAAYWLLCPGCHVQAHLSDSPQAVQEQRAQRHPSRQEVIALVEAELRREGYLPTLEEG